MVDDYYSFKRDLLNQTSCFSDKDVRELVGEYAGIIESNRRCSFIKGINDLILVLEKRDHVSSDNYSELRNIVNRLPAEGRNKMLARLSNRRTVDPGDYPNNNGPRNTPPHSSTQDTSSNNNALPAYVSNSQSLVLFQSRSINKQKMHRDLLQALGKARRKDLQDRVEEYFANMD
ncbi:Protein of unknown function [Gryllus bimaculatus]|nr:Protein of unknown function [Gryllus bimaculatus]